MSFNFLWNNVVITYIRYQLEKKLEKAFLVFSLLLLSVIEGSKRSNNFLEVFNLFAVCTLGEHSV